jgi:hypothetical protein
VTLSVKKSRAISINGEDYRYQVSTTRIDDDWNFTLNLTVQRWSPPLGVLEVKGLVTREYWLDISDGANWNINDYPVLLPKHIQTLVMVAKNVDWKSQVKGKSFILSTNNGSVFKT